MRTKSLYLRSGTGTYEPQPQVPGPVLLPVPTPVSQTQTQYQHSHANATLNLNQLPVYVVGLDKNYEETDTENVEAELIEEEEVTEEELSSDSECEDFLPFTSYYGNNSLVEYVHKKISSKKEEVIIKIGGEGKSRRCLICFGEKSHNENEGDKPNELKDNLRVMFLLKRVFEISSTELINFMQHAKGCSPAKWIYICPDCIGLVRKAVEVHDKMQVLERKIKNYQAEIMEKVRRSSIDQYIEEEDDPVSRKVRKLVLCMSITPAQMSSPFVSGDQQAEILHIARMNNAKLIELEVERKTAGINPSLAQKRNEESDFVSEVGLEFESHMEHLDTEPTDLDQRSVPPSEPENSSVEDDLEDEEMKEEQPDEEMEPSDCGTEDEADSGPSDVDDSDISEIDFKHDVIVELENKMEVDHQNLKRSSSSSPTKPIPTPLVKKSTHQHCEICSQKIPKPLMYDHMVKHVGEFAAQCPVDNCPYTSPTIFSSRFIDHVHLELSRTRKARKRKGIDLGSKKVIKKCSKCGNEFDNFVKFARHLQAEHETLVKNYTCPIKGCGKTYTVRQSVEYHLRDHIKEPKNLIKQIKRKEQQLLALQPCSVCHEKYGPSEIENHLREKHNSNEIIKCSKCSFCFPDREALLDHCVNKKYGHTYEGVSCDLCSDGVLFYQPLPLRQHYFSEHQVGKQFPCEFESCDFIGYSAYSLQSHQKKTKSHSSLLGNEPKPFQCDICDDPPTAFSQKNSLISHKIRCHGATPFSCKFCPETFDDKVKLARHEDKIHLGKRYPCKICGKVFNTRQVYTSHQRISHFNLLQSDGASEMVCETCGKVFSNISTLRKHEASEHSTSASKHVCETCGKIFTKLGCLKRHQRSHEKCQDADET